MKIRGMAVATTLLLVAACTGSEDMGAEPRATPTPTPTQAASPSPTPAVIYPGNSWQRADQGDWTDLDTDLENDASTCVAVIKDGKLVHDAYWNGGGERTQQRTYSITKSLTSLLVGMQVDDSLLELDGPAAGKVAQWQNTPAEAITVRSLLSMTSGRAWSDATDRQMIRSTADQTAYAVGLPQAQAPGQAWVYDNAAAQTLDEVLAVASGDEDVAGLALDRLLGPLGMRSTTWGRDAAGNALTYSGATSTCLDLARVGYLMLHQGRWNGEQLLSADYVREATTPSSTLNSAYGLLWWTNASGRIVTILRQAGFPIDEAPYEGQLAPNVPADAFWALGYGNQYIAVVPSEGVVAVRLGRRPATPDRVTFDSFTGGVLDALR